MISLSNRIYAHRAALALHTLFGGAARAIYAGRGLRAVLELEDRGFMVAAGDHEDSLDLNRLKPLALEHGLPVAATYVDPFKSGHRFQFDIVLFREGTATLFPQCRLWIPQMGPLHFVPDRGDGSCIAIGERGLVETITPPFRNKGRKMLGIARSQAELQHLVYGGTPFAKANDRWLHY